MSPGHRAKLMAGASEFTFLVVPFVLMVCLGALNGI